MSDQNDLDLTDSNAGNETTSGWSRRTFLAATGASLLASSLPVAPVRGAVGVDADQPGAVGGPSPMSDEALCFSSPEKLAELIKTRQLSAVEAMTAYYDRIEVVNPKINAICTLLERDKALGMARLADEATVKGEPLGPLHGVPLAIKDTAETKGMRTTLGSNLTKDYMPEKDSLYVSRLREAGGLIIGKTNVPEFGAGSNTFNKVFGATRNPYNLAKSAGGSSGGAAAALAAGLIPIADGSDMGGSLRNPGSFCNLIGFRPSIGRVPGVSEDNGWQSRMVVDGPIGRTARDVAHHLAIMSGPDPRDPMSIGEPGSVFLNPLERDFNGAKVAWAGDLGFLPCEPEVLTVCQQAMSQFEALGCVVESAQPDMTGAMEAFQIERAVNFAGIGYGVPRLLWWMMKDTVVWNVKKGMKLGIKEILHAAELRTAVYQRVIEFLTQYDFIALPTSQVAPFDVETEWVKKINGQKMDTYIDWMASCCIFTITGLPAVSIPCGFTKQGLPVGLQVVAGFRKDFELLQLVHAFEQVEQYAQVRPTFVG